MQRVGHAVVQGIKILPNMGRQHELLTNQVQHFLLGLRVSQVGVQEMLAKGLRCILQLLHPKGADRLHNVAADTPQWRLSGCAIRRSVGLTKWHIHPLLTF